MFCVSYCNLQISDNIKINNSSEELILKLEQSHMARFCANLAFLFPEKSLLERYKLAKEAGFKAVESGFPLGFSKREVTEAKNTSGLQQVLINIYTGL